MKFSGDFNRNFSNANGSNNLDYKKDLILDEVAKLIELDKGAILSTLKDAGYYNISPNVSKKELIFLVVDALYGSEQFRYDISNLITKANSTYSNAVDPISAIAAAVGEVFKFGGQGFAFGQSKQQTKQVKEQTEQVKEQTRQQLYDKLLMEEKTNWMPIIVVSGVLLIGGIVTFLVLRSRRNKNNSSQD